MLGGVELGDASKRCMSIPLMNNDLDIILVERPGNVVGISNEAERIAYVHTDPIYKRGAFSMILSCALRQEGGKTPGFNFWSRRAVGSRRTTE